MNEAVELYRSVAMAYHESGRLAQASAVCRSVLELEPGQPETLQLLALLDQAQRSGEEQAAEVVEEADTAEREKWVPSLAPNPARPAPNQSPRGKVGIGRVPVDASPFLTPTPLPEPLAPHEADPNSSVAESKIRRYPLPVDPAPDGPLPKVSLPGNLPPVDDDLLPTSEEDALPSSLVDGSAHEAHHPPRERRSAPLPMLSIAAFDDDEPTALADRASLERMRDNAVVAGEVPSDPQAQRTTTPLPSFDDPENHRPTTPLPIPAIVEPDDPFQTGRLERDGGGTPGDHDGDDSVQTGRHRQGKKQRIEQAAAELDARLRQLPTDTLRERPHDNETPLPFEIPALRIADTESEAPAAMDNVEADQSIDTSADLSGRSASSPVGPGVDFVNDALEEATEQVPAMQLASQPGQPNSRLSTGVADGPVAGERAQRRPSSDGWNDEPTTKYSTYSEEDHARAESALLSEAGRHPSAPAPDEEDPHDDGPTTEEAPPLSPNEVRETALAQQARDQAAEAAREAFEADEETEADLDALPRRPDGLPSVIHDDMELGDAFHLVLGSNGPLGEARAPLSIFSSLPREAVSDLAERMTLRHFDSGKHIVREGEPSETCYVIVSGEVAVMRNDPVAGEPVEIVRLDDGSLFGELALLANRHRRASVRAVQDCHAYEISRRLLRELAASYLEVGPQLERIYRDRLLASTVNTAPFLRTLPEIEISEMRRKFETVRCDTGEPIIREGSRAGGFYLIVLGSVDITQRVSEKRSKLLATLNEGAYFGDMALANGDMAMVSVRAAGPTELIALSPEDFYSVIEKSPGLWERIRDQGRRPDLDNNQLLTGETYLT